MNRVESERFDIGKWNWWWKEGQIADKTDKKSEKSEWEAIICREFSRFFVAAILYRLSHLWLNNHISSFRFQINTPLVAYKLDFREQRSKKIEFDTWNRNWNSGGAFGGAEVTVVSVDSFCLNRNLDGERALSERARMSLSWSVSSFMVVIRWNGTVNCILATNAMRMSRR